LRHCVLRRLRLRRVLHFLGEMSLGVLTATTLRPTSTVTAYRAGPCLARLFLLDLRRYPRASAGPASCLIFARAAGRSNQRRRARRVTALSQPEEHLPRNGDPYWR
jgi:hypothetical protein